MQYIVTFISFVFISLVMSLFWWVNESSEYSSLGMSIYLSIGYVIAIAGGVIALIKRPFKNKGSLSVSFFNFVATFNICIGIAGGIFIFSENKNKLTEQLAIFLAPLVVGLAILYSIYFKRFPKD
ncbi:MAG: hypothetical protein QM726_12810 [Chitinophagaceae bacterium]